MIASPQSISKKIDLIHCASLFLNHIEFISMSPGCHDAHPIPVLVLEAQTNHWGFNAARNRGSAPPRYSIEAQRVLVAPDCSPDSTRLDYSMRLVDNRTINIIALPRFGRDVRV